MKVKGRYVVQIEYDFVFDDTVPNTRTVNEIRNMFTSGEAEIGITNIMNEEVFDPSFGKCSVTQMYFDMHELPEED